MCVLVEMVPSQQSIFTVEILLVEKKDVPLVLLLMVMSNKIFRLLYTIYTIIHKCICKLIYDWLTGVIDEKYILQNRQN